MTLLLWCFWSQVGANDVWLSNLRQRIESRDDRGVIPASRPILSSDLVRALYESNGFKPVWVNRGEALNRLRTALLDLAKDGLDPHHYHVDALGELASMSVGAGRLQAGQKVDCELFASDAFLTAARHLLNGRLDPKTLDSDWHVRRTERDPLEIMKNALREERISEVLLALRPDHPVYQQLLRRESELQVAGQNEPAAVPVGSLLRAGQRDERVRLIRARLGNFYLGKRNVPLDDDLYDDALKDHVIYFQRQHGLDPDGIVGPETLGYLNWSIDDRVAVIAANMERWRWLPENLGPDYIIVNIAGFELSVVEANQPVMNLRVIVGRDARRTPVFSAKLSYLVLSPSWNVPHKLAVEDKLPVIKKNPAYLAEQGMRVFRGWGADALVMDPQEIDWQSLTRRNFPYRLRQDPGPNNALGSVKFMFPNEFSVYLHDTPARELFSKSQRAFSSGCIRVDRPMDLAMYLLRDQNQWTLERVERVLERREETTVNISKPIPVHLLYWTVWLDQDGLLQWRKDIYGRDRDLVAALAKPE